MINQSSYNRDELNQCGYGEMFGKGNAQLPKPPMLMMDRIVKITEDTGLYGKGEMITTLYLASDITVIKMPAVKLSVRFHAQPFIHCLEKEFRM